MSLRPFTPFKPGQRPAQAFDPRAGKTDLLQKPNITQWTLGGQTAAIVAGGGPDGTDAYSVLSAGGFIFWISDILQIGQTYTFGAFVKVPSGFACACRAGELYGSGSFYHTNGLFLNFVNNQAEWTLREQTITALAVQSMFAIGLSDFGSGEKFEIWKPMIYAGSKVS